MPAHRDPGESFELLLHALAGIAERLDALPARIASELQRGAVSLTAADRRALERLLPRLSLELGDAVWSLRDLAEDSPELCAALRSAVGNRDASPKQIGKWLGHAKDATVDGLRLEAAGKCSSGALWRVRRL